MSNDIYDIIIIGGGPAGLTAGIYASRARMKTLLLESMSVMAQATMTDFIENYPGVENATGFDLINTFKKQAVSFGLECKVGHVESIKQVTEGSLPLWEIKDENGEYRAISVIIATGAKGARLGVLGEEKFLGKGVSYCATCDGAFFRNKDIVVVGGGNSAVEEAIFLTKFGKTVTVIHRREELRADKILQERASSNEKIKFVLGYVVDEIKGAAKVQAVSVKNIKTGEEKEIPCEGVFIFVGWIPNTDFLIGLVELDKYGCIVVGPDAKTSQNGLYAGGDSCAKVLHQIVTATGDGAVAAVSAEKYVEELKKS